VKCSCPVHHVTVEARSRTDKYKNNTSVSFIEVRTYNIQYIFINYLKTELIL